jgi:hypothetical protein
MKLNIIKSIALVAFIAVFTSCTYTDTHTFSDTGSVKTYELTTTKSAADIIGTSETAYAGDDIIAAYVTSNDAGGNFYKSISFQTSLITDSGTPLGFSVSVDKSMLFVNGFTPGRKVYIKLKGLGIATVYGSTLLGITDSSSYTGISGISELDFQNYLFPSSTIVDESALVRHMVLKDAAKDPVQNTLVEVDNVEFADASLGRTYFDVNNGGYATNHTIYDYAAGGVPQVCRISQYAPFSSGNVPSGRGSIRGVMTKYNTTYQFMVRQEGDFKLTNPRSYTFFSSLNETFASYSTSQTAFQNYLNFYTTGTKNWLIKSGALEMSSYGGAVEANKSYFIIPVDMTAASSLKFDIKAGFYTNGLGLRVYRSMDYVPGMKISQATLADISTSFTLPSASTTSFASAGTYNIPASVTGNGYFIFEYTGTNVSTGPPVTTTVDIDNIVIN